MKTIFSALLCLTILACSTGCGSGGGDTGSTTPVVNPPPPATTDIHTVKGIDFDSLTSTQTDGSLIATPTASFTSVQRVTSGLVGGLDPTAQTQWYDVSSSVASDLVFSQTILPCTKLTLTRSNLDVGVLTTFTVSYYFAKAVSGDTYLMKKTFRNGAYTGPNSETVFDLTGAIGTPLLAAPHDPVVGSVCFYPLALSSLSPSADMAAVGGTCTVSQANATTLQGVTGCTRLIRNGYNSDLYVKPGIGFVYWIERLSLSTGTTYSQTRTGLVGNG